MVRRRKGRGHGIRKGSGHGVRKDSAHRGRKGSTTARAAATVREGRSHGSRKGRGRALTKRRGHVLRTVHAVLTRDDLVAVMPRAASTANGMTDALGAAMARFGIHRPARKAAFLAQLAHESGQLSRWTENLDYRWQRLRQIFPKYFRTDRDAQMFDRQPERIANRVYGGRLGNGPEATGDGWRYRGRGPIQLTGKDNYRTCGAALDVDLLARPELLETPEVGCLAAAWFWASKGLNALADAGDFVTITRRINGGLIGLADRQELWERAKAVFGVAARVPERVVNKAVAGASRRRRLRRRAALRPRRRRLARARTRTVTRKARRAARTPPLRRRAPAGKRAGPQRAGRKPAALKRAIRKGAIRQRAGRERTSERRVGRKLARRKVMAAGGVRRRRRSPRARTRPAR
jgi:putative chitinase